jgi:hypothetical protein
MYCNLMLRLVVREPEIAPPPKGIYGIFLVMLLIPYKDEIQLFATWQLLLKLKKKDFNIANCNNVYIGLLMFAFLFIYFLNYL